MALDISRGWLLTTAEKQDNCEVRIGVGVFLGHVPPQDGDRKGSLMHKVANNPQERMLKWFAYDHLPEKLQSASKPFGELANRLCEMAQPGPERTVALRKLLEAKDAAVRAVLNPGS
jgi:hypothetical protein